MYSEYHVVVAWESVCSRMAATFREEQPRAGKKVVATTHMRLLRKFEVRCWRSLLTSTRRLIERCIANKKL